MDELLTEKILSILQDCYHQDITPDEGLELIDELIGEVGDE